MEQKHSLQSQAAVLTLPVSGGVGSYTLSISFLILGIGFCAFLDPLHPLGIACLLLAQLSYVYFPILEVDSAVSSVTLRSLSSRASRENLKKIEIIRKRRFSNRGLCYSYLLRAPGSNVVDIAEFRSLQRAERFAEVVAGFLDIDLHYRFEKPNKFSRVKLRSHFDWISDTLVVHIPAREGDGSKSSFPMLLLGMFVLCTQTLWQQDYGIVQEVLVVVAACVSILAGYRLSKSLSAGEAYIEAGPLGLTVEQMPSYGIFRRTEFSPEEISKSLAICCDLDLAPLKKPVDGSAVVIRCANKKLRLAQHLSIEEQMYLVSHIKRALRA